MSEKWKPVSEWVGGDGATEGKDEPGIENNEIEVTDDVKGEDACAAEKMEVVKGDEEEEEEQEEKDEGEGAGGGRAE